MYKQVILFSLLIVVVVVVSGCTQLGSTPTPKQTPANESQNCNYDDQNKDYVFRSWDHNACPIFDPVDKSGWKIFSNECGCGYEKVQIITPEPTNSFNETGKVQASNPFHLIKDTGISQWYYITGIIQNIGEDPIKHVRANVTYYLKNGTKQYRDDIVVWPAHLEPGQKGAFEYQVGQIETDNKFDMGNYKTEPSTFKIDENKLVKDIAEVGKRSDDTYFIATIKNTGQRKLTTYGANIITYDNVGHVISVSPVKLIPSSLKELLPGQTTEFKSVISHPNKELRENSFDIEFDYSEVK
ncbi:MAG: hypothetical protein HY512_04355 [Candidatus Aenigmarchaeota archaeon]|nr:hypothetical protein [Candidatus Aenigmarchaeota archaeon]